MPRGRGKTVGKYFLWPDYNNLLGVKLCIIFNWHYCQPIPFKSIYDLEQVFCAHFFVFMWLYSCVSLQWGCTWVRKPPTGLWWGLQNTMGSFPLKVDFHFKCLFRKTSPSLHCPLHLIHLRVALSPREPHVPTKTFTSLWPWSSAFAPSTGDLKAVNGCSAKWAVTTLCCVVLYRWTGQSPWSCFILCDKVLTGRGWW